MRTASPAAKEFDLKLRIMSDLHLGFAPMTPHETQANVMIVAGDIHLGAKGFAQHGPMGRFNGSTDRRPGEQGFEPENNRRDLGISSMHAEFSKPV